MNKLRFLAQQVNILKTVDKTKSFVSHFQKNDLDAYLGKEVCWLGPPPPVQPQRAAPHNFSPTTADFLDFVDSQPAIGLNASFEVDMGFVQTAGQDVFVNGGGTFVIKDEPMGTMIVQEAEAGLASSLQTEDLHSTSGTHKKRRQLFLLL